MSGIILTRISLGLSVISLGLCLINLYIKLRENNKK